MKTLLAFLTVSLIAMSSFTTYAHEDVDCIACFASVGQLDILAQEAKEGLKDKLNKMGDTDDLTEGKIRAAMINMIEDGLNKVDRDIEEYGMTSNRSMADDIIKEIEKINQLIKEL